MNKGFGLNGALVVILILLVVGTAGIYVVKKTDLITKDTNDVTFVEENQKDDNKQIVTEQLKNEVAVKDEAGEATNWKTYRNEEYRFEIKYPKDWITHENQNFITTKSFINRNDVEEGKDSFVKVYDASLSFREINPSAQDYVRLKCVGDPKEIMMNNQWVYCLTMSEDSTLHNYFLNSNTSKFLSFTAKSDGGVLSPEELKHITEQILSTLNRF